jgi:hypothetical protein
MMTAPVARLTLATDAEYAEFAALQLKEYARQLVRAGEVAAEDGAAAAAERLQDLLAACARSATLSSLPRRLRGVFESVGSGSPQRRSLSVLVMTTRAGYLS